MNRPSAQATLIAAVVALASATCIALPHFDLLEGVSIDALTAMRWHLFGASRPPASSPTVVVALDEETYDTPPFAGTPSVTWTGEIGRVVTAVLDGGANVVGFDLIFPTSIEQSQIRFGNETVGARMRGFDRDFLRAIAVAAQSDKIVLGEIQHQDRPILPAPGQRGAVGHLRNIRPLNTYTDSDGVIRRMPLSFSVDGTTLPSMAVEVAARTLGVAPQLTPDGAAKLRDYAVPNAIANTMTLNFEGGADDIPTYSLADLRACIEKGDNDFFRRHFADRIVLVGTVLDSEDRKLSSKRFATGREGGRAARCASAVPANAMARFERDSIAGVYLHATAINNLINRDALTEFGTLPRFACAAAFAILMAAAALLFGPFSATLISLTFAAVWLASAVLLFRSAVVLPLLEPMLAGVLTLGTMAGYRFAVADRDRRLLRQSFGLYLAPELVDRLVASNKPPTLGGEVRQVSVFFSDIAGFSTMAETLAPSALVVLINEYFREMTEIIEAHDGFVDKYIGDAVVAVFGAPLDDLDHARKAAGAALACQARLDELRSHNGQFASHRLITRIGLSSGETLVGNIGSHRHFNYTVMGDAVNVAARLAEANKYLGSVVLASEATMVLARDAFVWRELDLLRLPSRDAPVRVFEPLAFAENRSAELDTRSAIYADGLARWRKRDFAGAAQQFALIAGSDAPAAAFRTRAEALMRQPPDQHWDPSFVLRKT